jgi:hypothetical protein
MNTTDITLLLDRSGSMQSIASDTIGGINTFLKEQQALPGDATFSLVLFSSNGYERVITRRPIREVQPLTSLATMGMTPLLDAMAETIDETGARLRDLPLEKRPAHVVMVVVTDGLENDSRRFTRDQVFAKIQHQRDHYQWLFLYLGANQDAIAVGRDLGIHVNHAGTYGISEQSVNAMYRNVSAKVADNRAGIPMASVAFTDAERTSMADETTAPDSTTTAS